MSQPFAQNKPRYAAEAMGKIHHLHFIGIGGAGMNGIAQVMLNLGYTISGSDLRENVSIQHLREQGANIQIGHAAQNIAQADAVIISSAVAQDNPEVVAARQARIPVVPRAEMLAEIMRFRYGVAVAGTHGKTTTTSLIASLLIDAGLDPTYVIGGCLNAAGNHAHLGTGEVLVAEADESDASFLYLQPMLAVVTNIDEDHMSTYAGEFARLRSAFLRFLHHLPFYGMAVMCIDDANVRDLSPEVARRLTTYGFSADADVRALNYQQQAGITRFDVQTAGHAAFQIELSLPGRHNVLNALAAISVALELGVDIPVMQQTLRQFQGIGRRFEIRHCMRNGQQLTLVDDYGHHPSELAATLSAVRDGWVEKRLVLAFQPHRYSRTRDTFNAFSKVLSAVDVLVLCEVYAAGETPIPGADGQALIQAVRKIRTPDQTAPVFVDHIQDLPNALQDIIQADDIVLTMGAGDIGAIARQLPEVLAT